MWHSPFIHSNFLLFLCDLTVNTAEVGSAHTAYCSFSAEGSVSIHPLSEFGWEVGESLLFWVADVDLLLSHSSQKWALPGSWGVQHEGKDLPCKQRMTNKHESLTPLNSISHSSAPRVTNARSGFSVSSHVLQHLWNECFGQEQPMLPSSAAGFLWLWAGFASVCGAQVTVVTEAPLVVQCWGAV